MQTPLHNDIPTDSCTIEINTSDIYTSIQRSINRLFDKQPVTVKETQNKNQDAIVLKRNGEFITSSTTKELMRSIFLVNSDIYITGTRDLTDSDLPDVLAALHDIPFRLRGYPESNTEKMLLIAVSRDIEKQAYNIGEGTLHVGFQKLSRLTEEKGTLQVYEQLSKTDIDIHAYGNGDSNIPEAISVTPHIGDSWYHNRYWFVIYTPNNATDDPIALYTIEREPNRWCGFWTYKSDRIHSLKTHIKKKMM